MTLLMQRPRFSFRHSFAAGPVVSNINTLTALSGHKFDLSFATSAGNELRTAAMADGTVGMTIQGSTNSAYGHGLAYLGQDICFLRWRKKFLNNGSTHNEVGALIPWRINRTATDGVNAATAQSPVHTLHFYNRLQPQTYNRGSAASPWTTNGEQHGDLGTGYRDYEYAIDKPNSAVVARMPHGKVREYTDTLVDDWLLTWLDAELGNGSAASTDGDMMVFEVEAETMLGITENPLARAYINRLLAVTGRGPLLPLDNPLFVGAFGVQGTTISADVLNRIPFKAGDLIVMHAYRGVGATAVPIPASSGWSEWPGGELVTTGNINGSRVVYKYADVSSTIHGGAGNVTIGDWSTGNGVTHLQVQVWRNAAPGAASANFGSNSNAITFPAFSFDSASTSRMGLFYGSRGGSNGDPPVSATGFKLVDCIDNSSSSTQDVCSYISDDTMTGFSELVLNPGGGTSGYNALALQIKAA
ncbi:hypothetical protein [Mycolicibacterium sp. XJ1819]